MAGMLTPKGEPRPVGPEVATTPAKLPQRITLQGRFVTVEPLTIDHTDELFDALGRPEWGWVWDYMLHGPFKNKQEFRNHISSSAQSVDPLFFAVRDNASNRAIGCATLMRIDPVNRVIEVGNICFSPLLQQTSGATECMYLLAKTVFEDLGYRRYEWKCHNLNAPSKRAAGRLGFTFEGVFRQAVIVKGRSRDTAWFSMLDTEWPKVKRAFEAWLDPSNFDEESRQRASLATLRDAV